MLRLIIGNRAYSSWSMRGWLAVKQSGEPFEEFVVPLFDAEWEKRRAAWTAPTLHHQTPWQEMYRMHVGQLADGGCLELATAYHKVAKDLPRDNH